MANSSEPVELATEKEVSGDLAKELDDASSVLNDVRLAIGKVILGQKKVVDRALACVLSGGHVLIIGVPGLAKTKLVETMGQVLGLKEQRIQCTPDLMPADILGSEVLEHTGGHTDFRFIEGPIFTQLFMADEINRASPRTQSALLQAMQEKRVSIGGIYHDLPKPFHVLATQNPIEQEGTYPLPEAQLDRFLMQINISYTDRDHERQMLLITTGEEEDPPQQIIKDKDLQKVQTLVRRIPVGESVVEGILTLVRSGRPEESEIPEVQKHVAWGPGPRASQAFMMSIRAMALLDGRYAPSLDDVLDLAKPILQHRMALTFAARAEGITLDDIIDKMCKAIK